MKYLLFFCLFISQVSKGQDTAKIKKLFLQALDYENKGDLQNALKTQLKIFNLDSGNYASANVIAGLYGKLSNFDEEINWAKKSVSIYPFSNGYINLGNGFAGSGNIERAEENFKQAALMDSLSPLPFYSLGVVEENKRNLLSAIKYYEKSVLLDSTFANGYFNLAAAYANMKDFKNANENIVKYLQINPGDKDAQEMYEHIIAEFLK
jgi:protein O-GlcNAc transferase